MRIASALLPGLFTTLALGLSGCKKDEAAGDDGKAAESKGDAKDDKKGDDKGEADEEGSLKVATGDEGVDGPVPPDSSMVFFTVEGALLPLACFDKDKGKVDSGDACLDLVPKDGTLRVSSVDSEYNKPVGERIEPDCTAGSGKKNALQIEGMDDSANYKFGTWPPSGIKTVKVVPDSTTDDGTISLSDEEKTSLGKAIGRDGAGLEPHQIAEIDADGNDKKDKIYSVWIPDPKVSEQYAWSGILIALDDDLTKLVLLETSKSKKDVYEVKGTLDLDGDKKPELWMRQVFAEGSGDRLLKVNEKGPDPIGKWSCGA